MGALREDFLLDGLDLVDAALVASAIFVRAAIPDLIEVTCMPDSVAALMAAPPVENRSATTATATRMIFDATFCWTIGSRAPLLPRR